MKKECAVVQDLLVLYEDDVLKEESRQMVEEHIRGCGECMQLYEKSTKPLPVIEKAPESSEEEQEGAAVWVMKKLKKRMTYKTVMSFGVIVVLFCFAITAVNAVCSRKIEGYTGIAGTIFTLPAGNSHVVQLYQLKNGDLYCELGTDSEFSISSVADWVIPLENQEESTKEAQKEIHFKRVPFWEWNTVRKTQSKMVFTLERKGTVTENGETRTVTQSCADISVYGKTKKDKMTVWKEGQKVEAAPEDIEKEAVRAYLQDGLFVKALKECQNMGWEDYEEIFGDTVPGWDMGDTGIEDGQKVTFPDKGNTVTIF